MLFKKIFVIIVSLSWSFLVPFAIITSFIEQFDHVAVCTFICVLGSVLLALYWEHELNKEKIK